MLSSAVHAGIRSDVDTLISLDKIVTGATVRLGVIDDTQYLSVRDLIRHLCNKDNKQACQIWDRLTLDQKEKLSPFLASFRFVGHRQREQPVITFRGAVQLITMLPGKHAQLYSMKFAEVVSRYLEGDDELRQEIEENKSIGIKRSYSRFAQDVERSVQEEQDNMDFFPQIQYIYATKSLAFPGLIKIGRTINMKARLSTLNSSCAPAPHVVVAIAPTLDMFRDEYLAHHWFAESRREGEFFAVTEQQVKDYFSNVIVRRYEEDLLQYAASEGTSGDADESTKSAFVSSLTNQEN